LGAQASQEAALLTDAQMLIDEIEADVNQAQDKIDEAAQLNVQETQQRYLEAKSESMEAMLALTGTMRQLTDVLLADPGAQNPETLQKWADLGQTMSEQVLRLQEAEAAAGKILEEDGE
jgi:regulatory protein YycH of two-component signal transduction system YycFG